MGSRRHLDCRVSGAESAIDALEEMQGEYDKLESTLEDVRKELLAAHREKDALEAKVEELEEKLENAPWSFLEEPAGGGGSADRSS
jgi:predicted  nucleic acid-binding Zn-ribbon protein